MAQERVRELSLKTDTAIDGHLRDELSSARERAASIVAPFALLVDDVASLHSARASKLNASRQALDSLAREAERLAAGGQGRTLG